MSSVLALVGDSDIAFWPADLQPRAQSVDSVVVNGVSGLCLIDVIPLLANVLKDHESADRMIVVACAGENDIGNSISLDSTLQAFGQFLDLMFPAKKSVQNRRLFFLGPKFEPWMQDDNSARKQYGRMSRAFQRACNSHASANSISFIDCLGMFCGDSAKLPGAILGGKAIPDRKLFGSDQLHLSKYGYEIWKQVIEDALNCI